MESVRKEIKSNNDEVLDLIEKAVSKEERACKSGICQLNCRIEALTNEINALNATPCSWGGWIKSLWR